MTHADLLGASVSEQGDDRVVLCAGQPGGCELRGRWLLEHVHTLGCQHTPSGSIVRGSWLESMYRFETDLQGGTRAIEDVPTGWDILVPRFLFLGGGLRFGRR
jgi:hypothetical protein